jgi:hypothetical protein
VIEIQDAKRVLDLAIHAARNPEKFPELTQYVCKSSVLRMALIEGLRVLEDRATAPEKERPAVVRKVVPPLVTQVVPPQAKPQAKPTPPPPPQEKKDESFTADEKRALMIAFSKLLNTI